MVYTVSGIFYMWNVLKNNLISMFFQNDVRISFFILRWKSLDESEKRDTMVI